MAKIKDSLTGVDGYVTGLSFSPQELDMVRELVKAQFLERISVRNSSVNPVFKKNEMDRYHEYSHLLDHDSLWPKAARILDMSAVEKIRGTSLFNKLEEEFGVFAISDEDNIGHEEIYWRLVRPNSPTDVGPLHADAWFWDLGHGQTPAGAQRVKVWISLYSEAGKNGFQFVPGSHQREWKYHGVHKHGIIKPQIDEDLTSLDRAIFNGKPGDAIVFHDRLLHGGIIGGTTTRVSLEFTIFARYS